MKRNFICLVIIVAMAHAIPATAATMCVQLDVNKSCTFEDPGDFTSDWTTTCSGVPVSGIAYCSNQRAAYKDKSDSITISGTVEENVNCWCRMVSPAVSSWVFNFVFVSASDCAQYCANRCESYAVGERAFRLAMFSDLH